MNFWKRLLSSTVSTISSFAIAASPLMSARVGIAQTLPVNGQVEAGSATIANPTANSLTVNQTTDRAVIGWDAFSIGAGNQVTFQVPTSSGATLNRVNGSMTSTIAGQLQSNGQLYLVNPNGILITPSSSINTNAFVGSSLDISNSDFMTGKDHFVGNGSSADVENQGLIRTQDGGVAVLLGGRVVNSGTIEANGGAVGLGAGEDITLDLTGDGLLSVTVPSSNANQTRALISQTGQIKAKGGRVELKAATSAMLPSAAIQVTGAIEADSVAPIKNGVSFGGAAPAQPRMRKAPAPGKAGTVVIDAGAGGTAIVSGPVTANSDTDKGGLITITGRDVQLRGAMVSATGATGGGTIEVGGSAEGKGPLANASTTLIDELSKLDVSATDNGNGGNAVVWSDQNTQFRGSIDAKGGDNGGDGGNVEVSGKAHLSYSGSVNTLAAKGKTGNLLLDPYNVTISTGTDTNQSSFTATGTGSIINTTTLQNALASSNVTVSTGASGAETGNITVANAITWSANTTLTLTAAGGIILNANVTNSGATSGFTMNAAGTGGISGAGNIASNGVTTFNLTATGGAGSAYSGVISGTGSVAYTGSSFIVISGASTYSGGTSISGGTYIQVQNASAFGTGAVTINANSGLQLWISGGATISNNFTNNSAGPSGNASAYTGISAKSAIFGDGAGGGGNYTLSGTITLGNAASSIGSYSSANSITITGQVTGSGGLAAYQTQTAGSLVTLSNATNNYTGSTTVGGAGGTLKMGVANAIPSTSALTVASGSTLDLNGFNTSVGSLAGAGAVTNSGAAATVTAGGNNTSTTFSGVIQNGTGATALTKAGSGTLTLSGTNTYSGTTTVNVGTLAFMANQASTSGVTVASGATLSLSNNAAISNPTAGATSISGTVTGNGTLYGYASGSTAMTIAGTAALNASGGTLTLSANGANTSGIALNISGSLTTTGSVAMNLNASGGTGSRRIMVLNGNTTINATSGTFTLTGIQNGSDVGLLTGTNILTLGGTQNWSMGSSFGNAWAGAGSVFNLTTLASAVINLNATGGIDTNLSGSTWTLGSGSSLTINRIGLNGSFTIGGTGTLNASLPLTGNSTATTGTGDNPVINGVISGGFGLTKSGSGTLTLSGANTYTGITTINAGTLQFAKQNSLYNATTASWTASNITVASGATLAVNYGGAGEFTSANIDTLIALGTATTGFKSGAIFGIDTSSGSQTYASNITNPNAGANAFGITKLGANTLTLTGTNTYTGATTVNAGTLAAGSASPLGSNSATTVSTGATLDLAGFNISVGSLTGGGTVTNSNSAAKNLTIGGDNTSTTFSGAIQNGTGATSIIKVGTGTLTLSGTNPYTGATTVNAGTLKAGSTAAFGSNIIFSNNPAVTIASGAVFDLAGFSNTVGTLIGAGTVTNSSATAVSLTLNTNNRNDTFTGVVQDGSGALSLILTGVGTQTLSGVNTYTGSTTINFPSYLIIGGSGSLGAGTYAGTISNWGVSSFTYSSSANQTFSGVISGGSGLVKDTSSTSTLTLSGANSYTSTTTVNAGTLKAGSTTALGTNSATTVANGATLDLAGFNVSIGSLAGAGTVTNSGVAATLTSGGDNSSTTFSGVIQNGTGATALTKTGIGTLILSGANTYTGTTTISAGTLQVGNGGTSGSLGTGSIVNNANLNYSYDTATIMTLPTSVTYSGSGNLTATAGNVLFGGNLAVGGALTLNSTTSSFLGAGNTAAPTITAGSVSLTGALFTAGPNTRTLTINTSAANGAIALNNVTSGKPGALWSYNNLIFNAGTGAITFTGTNTFSWWNSGASATFIGAVTGSGTITQNNAGSGNLALTFTNPSTSTFSGSVTGANIDFVSNGAGTQILTGSNTYSGTTTISAGTLQVGNGGTTGSLGSGNIVNNANLTYSFGSTTAVATPLNYSGTGNLSLTGGMVWYPGNLSVGGNLTINSTTSSNSWMNLQTNVNPVLTVGGTTSITGYLAGYNPGTNTLTLNASGAVTLNNITNGIQGNFWQWQTLNINAGSNAINVTGASVMSQNSFASTWNLTGQVNITGNISAGSTGVETLNVNNSASSTISGVLSGNIALQKNGAGTLTLSAANTYTGGTTIVSGTVNAAATTSAGTGTVTLGSAATGASNVAFLWAGSTTPSNAIVVSSQGTGTATIGTYSTGFSTYSGNISLQRDVIISDSSADRTTLTGIISGTGNITITGTRATFDSSSNSFVGTVTVNAGSILQTNADNVLNDNNLVNNGTFRFNSNTIERIGALTGSGSIVFITGSGTILSIGNNGASGTYTGTIGSTVVVVKNGAGTQVLSGTNTYTGSTTVNAGTLSIGSAGSLGSGAYAGTITVASGANFAYSSQCSTDPFRRHLRCG